MSILVGNMMDKLAYLLALAATPDGQRTFVKAVTAPRIKSKQTTKLSAVDVSKLIAAQEKRERKRQ